MDNATIAYIITGVSAVCSGIAAYIGNKNHKILNGGSKIVIVAPVPSLPLKTTVIDGITYQEVPK